MGRKAFSSSDGKFVQANPFDYEFDRNRYNEWERGYTGAYYDNLDKLEKKNES